MKKEKAIKIIIDSAKDYNTYLVNQNLLFIFGKPQKPEFFEATFLPHHFLHLTGVNVVKNHFRSSTDFYNKALRGDLRSDDFSLAANGTTEMKLRVLPQLMKIQHTAKMIGDYSFTKTSLYTEKLTGDITACLGFVRNDNYFVPNTALNEDMRNITVKPQSRMLAILRKSNEDLYYEEICYTAKGLDFQDISLPKTLSDKVYIQREATVQIAEQEEKIEKETPFPEPELPCESKSEKDIDIDK